MRRLILLPLLITIAVLGIVGGLALWIHNDTVYYRTNDAMVQSKVVTIDAPQAGSLTSLAVKKGDTVMAGQYLATINLTGGGTLNLNSPANGSILLTADQGQIVTPGYPIVVVSVPGAAAVGEATVFAFVDESVLRKLRIGQQADVTVDAYGGTMYTGKLQQILRQSASQFSQTPTTDNAANGNFTKVSQRVPVLIAIDPGPLSSDMLPGLSAEVTIHLF